MRSNEPNWEKIMEKEWGRPIVHESGHALMAVIQEIPCRGIAKQRAADGGRFCTLVAQQTLNSKSPGYFLFLAAGAAAEELIYGNYDAFGRCRQD